MKTDPARQSIDAALRDPQLMSAALALYENWLHDAEPLLKAHLKRDPFDVAAIRMLAELAGRIFISHITPTFRPAVVAFWIHRNSSLRRINYETNT